MKKNLKLIWNILQVIILVYVFFITFLVVNINEFGFSEVGKSTYVPVTKKVKKYLDFKTGDLLIIKNTENGFIFGNRFFVLNWIDFFKNI